MAPYHGTERPLKGIDLKNQPALQKMHTSAPLPGFNYQVLPVTQPLLRNHFPVRCGKWPASCWLELIKVDKPTKSNMCFMETPLRKPFLSCFSQVPVIAFRSRERQLVLVAAELLPLALYLFCHEEYLP